jgi:transcriptional regulator with XRE-family HTH domain
MNEQLKLLRQTLKLNQSKIAEALGIALKSWQQYEIGAMTPGGNVLEALHKKLGVNLNWLVSNKGEMFYKEAGIQYDRELLIQSITTLENCLSKNKMAIDPQKKSKVAVKLYENLKKSGVVAGNLEIIEIETKELLDLI